MSAIPPSIIYKVVGKWNQNVIDHMNYEQTNNLNFKVEILEKITSNNFKQISDDVMLISDYATGVFNNSYNITSYYESYYGIGGPQNKSLEYSVWFNKYSNDPHQIYINESSIMDNIWIAIFKANPAYQLLYMGFETGLYRSYPYRQINNYATMNYICLRNNMPTIGYDPMCRNWYINASQTDNVIFTYPYISASTQRSLISSAKKFGNDTGVVSVDIDMTKFENNILNAKISEHGYSYIIDNFGNTVIYPNLNRDQVYNILDLEFTNSIDKDNFKTIYANMTKKQPGQQKFTKNNNMWIITYRPVTDTNYIIAIVLPESDINDPINAIGYKSLETMNGGISIFAILTGMVILMSICLVYKISLGIVKPIKNFDNYTITITKGNISNELGIINADSHDISQMVIDFQNLIRALRFANDTFYNDNMDEAYKNYMEIEKIMNELRNKRGLGIVLNNKATALRMMNKAGEHIRDAHKLYNDAIKNAKELIAESKSGDSVRLFNITLANRLMNLALLYFDEKNYDEALRLLKESKKIHRENANILGELKVAGNMGMIYMNMGNITSADEILNGTYNEVLELYNSNRTTGNLEVLQYAAMNKGVHLINKKEYDHALQYLHFAVECTPKINTHIKNECIKNIIIAYKALGKDTSELETFTSRENVKKHITFVLDVSGSMACGRLDQCKTSLQEIINKYMYTHDTLSLITFNRTIKKRINMTKINDAEKENCIEIIKSLLADGSTAFYDALYDSVHDLKNLDGSGSNNWIIALTDGEDTDSIRKPDAVAKIVKESGVNLIIITVGNLTNYHDINSIVKSATKGLCIEAIDTTSIANAFKKASNIVMSGQINLETL